MHHSGAVERLQETEVVILKVSLFGIMTGGPQLCDAIVWMKGRGFVAYDIFGFFYRPLANALAQEDIVFVRERGRFPESQALATSAQGEAQGSGAREFAPLGAKRS